MKTRSILTERGGLIGTGNFEQAPEFGAETATGAGNV